MADAKLGCFIAEAENSLRTHYDKSLKLKEMGRIFTTLLVIVFKQISVLILLFS